jgi:DNA-binding NarL/FixJ family response regulator
MKNGKFTVGILEDDSSFCELLTAIIDADPRLELVFAVSFAADACAAFKVSEPDIVLVDMQLPDGTGLPLIRAATEAGKPSLMLTVLADRDSVLAAFGEGAQGYLLKDSPSAKISEGIHAALSGQSPISPEVAIFLLQLVRKVPDKAANAQPLTERELSILNMIARGLTYAEAAQAGGISVHTVGDHIKAIYRKLDVRSKSEAVHEARQLGWLSRFD